MTEYDFYLYYSHHWWMWRVESSGRTRQNSLWGVHRTSRQEKLVSGETKLQSNQCGGQCLRVVVQSWCRLVTIKASIKKFVKFKFGKCTYWWARWWLIVGPIPWESGESSALASHRQRSLHMSKREQSSAAWHWGHWWRCYLCRTHRQQPKILFQESCTIQRWPEFCLPIYRHSSRVVFRSSPGPRKHLEHILERP